MLSNQNFDTIFLAIMAHKPIEFFATISKKRQPKSEKTGKNLANFLTKLTK
jgi:hypothetical protein